MAEDFRMMPMSSRVAQGDTAVLKCLAPRLEIILEKVMRLVINDDEGGADVGKDGGDDGAENLGYTAILSVWHQGDNYRKLLLDFRH